MRYTYNETAFKDNTEKCYYFLGFIYADGCMKDNGEMVINISNKDVALLKSLAEYLETKKPIKYSTSINSCYISITNKIIYNNLLNFGLKPRKSLTNLFPDNIPTNMLCNFIRGYFDGDGCVSFKKGINKNRLRINFVGTYEFLYELQKKLIENIGIKKTKISNVTKDKNTYVFNVQGKLDVDNVKSFFYNQASIFLERKRKIFFTDTSLKNSSNKTTSKYTNVFCRKNKYWGITYYKNNKRVEKNGFRSEEEAYNMLCKMSEDITN